MTPELKADMIHVLMSADMRLSDLKAWTKEYYAIDSSGDQVGPVDASATAWSLVGALRWAMARPDMPLFRTHELVHHPRHLMLELNELARIVLNHQTDEYGETTLSSFNDDESTTFEDVKRLVVDMIHLLMVMPI